MEKVQSHFESFVSAFSQYTTRCWRATKMMGPVENLEKIRILEKEMYQELLISGLIIPFYFVCEMCEVFRMNQVKSMIIQTSTAKFL